MRIVKFEGSVSVRRIDLKGRIRMYGFDNKYTYRALQTYPLLQHIKR